MITFCKFANPMPIISLIYVTSKSVANNLNRQINHIHQGTLTQIHSSKFLHKLQTIYKEHPFFHPLTSSMIKHRIHYCNENLTHKRFSVDENGSLVHNK
uniref:Uncharacterized protein n=1 Tax=Populus trichocarpa TaxID=3694 RepID=A0A2K2BX80_POPTR